MIQDNDILFVKNSVEMIAKNHSSSARVGHGYVYFVILGGIFGMPEFFSIKMIL